jgi:hypothetical protein
VFDLVFCKTLFRNKYYIYCDIGYSVSLFCAVCVETRFLGTHITSILLALKLGVTKWYQSRVDRMNASLVRRVLSLVLFWGFAKIFYPSLPSVSHLCFLI